MTSFAETVARNVSVALARRAQETGEQVERMLAREQADIRSAIETKSSVDGKASVPRLRQQERQRALARAAEGAAEVAREIAAEMARSVR